MTGIYVPRRYKGTTTLDPRLNAIASLGNCVFACNFGDFAGKNYIQNQRGRNVTSSLSGNAKLTAGGLVVDGSSNTFLKVRHGFNLTHATQSLIIVGVTIPDGNQSGAFIKIGGSNGAAVGIGGSGTMDSDGFAINGLLEAVQWCGANAAITAGYHTVAILPYTVSGSTYAAISIDGSLPYATSTSSMLAADDVMYIGGYDTRLFNGTIHWAAIVNGAANSTTHLDGLLLVAPKLYPAGKWKPFTPANAPIFYSLPAAGGSTLGGAVVESTADTASGTIAFQHYVSGAVVESTSDTATGAISFQHYVSGAVVESAADTAAGTITVGSATIVSGAVVESTTDTAAGTISFAHYVSGAVVESGTDTAAGTLLGESWVSGAVVESAQDTASGHIDNLEAIVPVTQQPAGGVPGKARKAVKKRRRIVLGDQLYEVDDRDIPALLEAVLTDSTPPGTAEVVEAPKPKKPIKGKAAVAARAPEAVSMDMVEERAMLLRAEIASQAEQDVMRMLDRVAQRVMEEMLDEEDTLIALMMA